MYNEVCVRRLKKGVYMSMYILKKSLVLFALVPFFSLFGTNSAGSQANDDHQVAFRGGGGGRGGDFGRGGGNFNRGGGFNRGDFNRGIDRYGDYNRYDGYRGYGGYGYGRYGSNNYYLDSGYGGYNGSNIYYTLPYESDLQYDNQLYYQDQY